MKKTTKQVLLAAAAALTASLVPYELTRAENGDFSFTSLLLGVYTRRRDDGEKDITVTLGQAPCFTAESRRRRDAALRHAAEVAAEQAMFADNDEPTEGAAPAVKAPEAEEAAPVEEAPTEEAEAVEAATEEVAPAEEAPAGDAPEEA